MGPVHYHYGKFPPKKLNWPELIPLLGPAAAAVARYDGMLEAIPDPWLLLSPLTTQEAVLSSRIEGTQATMGEVLEFEAGEEAASPQRREDIHEVLNYRAAMNEAVRQLATLPLSLPVIREAHRALLSGVRGQHRSPGDYRKIPNWIGAPGCAVDEARFVPISADKLPQAINAWEKYVHYDAPDKLVQLAILHAEFESLHPFLDGNGRLGRMMVPLFMWQTGLIQRPMFYISAYFEARRDQYYDGLLSVSRDDDWTGWCRFFLNGVKAEAEDNLDKVRSIMALYERQKRQVVELTRSQYAIKALDWIFGKPIFKPSDFIAGSAIPEVTARRVLAVLREAEVLKELRPRRGQQAAVLAFHELVNIVEGRVSV